MRSEGYGTWFVSVCVCVCPFVCYHVFSDYAQRHNETAIPTDSSLNWLHFKKGDFRITTAFKSYGVKSKRKSHYANEYLLTAVLLQRPLAWCFDDRGF